MLKELEEMSKGQKLYNYECKSCGFEKGVPEFILEELRQIYIRRIKTRCILFIRSDSFAK